MKGIDKRTGATVRTAPNNVLPFTNVNFRKQSPLRTNLDHVVKNKTLQLTQINKKLAQRIKELQATEEALRLSEEKYHILFEYASEAITILDINGNIKELNRSALKLHKYKSKEELIGQNALDLILKADHKRVRDHFKRIRKGNGIKAVEYTFLTSEGKQFPGEMSMSLLKDRENNPVGVFTIVRDISERKKFEEELQFRAEILNAATDSIFVWDNRRNCIYINDAVCRNSGYCREELIGKNLSEIIPPDRFNIMKKLDDRFRQNGDVIYEAIDIRKDRNDVPSEVHSHIIKIAGKEYLVSISRDITDRKAAEKDLRLRAELLNNANDSIYVVDLEDNFVYANDTTLKTFGYTKEEISGLKLNDIVAPGYEYQTEEKRKFIAESTEDYFESASIRKDSSIFPCEIHAKLIELDNKKYVISVCRDITKRNQIFKELEDREKKLQSLMDASPVAICCIDSESNEISYINKKFVELFGYTLDDIPTLQNWIKLASPSPVLMSYHLSEENSPGDVSGQGENKPVETSIVCKNGSLCYTTAAFNTIGDQNVVIFMDITDKKKVEEEVKQIHEQLVAYVNKLKETERQNKILSEMRDLLQLCATVNEISPIISKSVSDLFPQMDGALFLMSPSRSDMEAVAKWGNFPEDTEDNVFEPDKCWGLRRGKIFPVLDIKEGPICSHIKHIDSRAYICMPLMAKSEVLGMLHVRSKKNLDQDEVKRQIESVMEIGITLSEYLSLSIANIKLRETLANQSIRDSLTGLYNRRYMEEAIQHEIMRAERKQNQIGIIMMDIDHFKIFNDTYGHKAGDALLIQLANLLKSSLRGSDIVCRYGGEEFIVILPETSVAKTYERAEHLREEIKKMQVYYHNESLPSVSISMGIASYPDCSTDIDELFNMSDEALYRAKSEGRDRVIIYKSAS